MRSLKWDGWSIGKRSADILLNILNEHKPKKILDIGSGLSTVLFSEWAAENNAEVISLEHTKKYYESTKKLLNQKVDLRLCDLIETKHGFFYKTELPNDIDFVLIDGPPGSIGRNATFYAVYPHLSKGYLAWLDDADRQGEREILKNWQADFPIQVTRAEGYERAALICEK